MHKSNEMPSTELVHGSIEMYALGHFQSPTLPQIVAFEGLELGP